jgi:hypothetical protein
VAGFVPACLLDDALMVKLFGASLKKAVKKVVECQSEKMSFNKHGGPKPPVTP